MNIEKVDPRREFLVDALGLGLFAGFGLAAVIQPVFALGGLPSKMAEGKSIYKLKGEVTIDGVVASLDSKISANSYIKTGNKSRVIFVVGTDAFLLRSNSELQMSGSGLLISSLRILTGKLLSVFGKRQTTHAMTTSTATIGIRGTGIYIESDPEKSYICTCYGQTRITANSDPGVVQDVATKHHDLPFYVLKEGTDSELIRPAPVINHTDSELAMIEALVGRKTPFPTAGYKAGGSGY